MSITVDCPTCKNKAEWNAHNPWRPFCSERCKQIDLGAWAEEKYVIPATTQTSNTPSFDSNLDS